MILEANLRAWGFVHAAMIQLQSIIQFKLTLLEVSSKNWKVFCTAWHVSSSVLLNAIK